MGAPENATYDVTVTNLNDACLYKYDSDTD